MILLRSMIAGSCALLFSFWAFADMALISGLYEDGLWEQCRIEAKRILMAEPDNREARWFMARAGSELGMDVGAILHELGQDPSAPSLVRWPARYQEALLLWRAGDRSEAAEALRDVFLNTEDAELFLLAGSSLAIALRQHEMPWGGAAGVGPQLRTAMAGWSDLMLKKARKNLATPKSSGVQAGAALITFYRTQISPAIGSRCVLMPSCSEYSRQAFAKHGLLAGIPVMADRFIREPGVVSAAERPLIVGGRTVFADPLSDHDWWWSDSREDPVGQDEK